MASEDGGSAFPNEGGPNSGLHSNPGMSLRDYFAAKAMQVAAYQQFAVALVKAISPDDQRVTLGIAPEVTAKEAYRIADAMLAARKEVQDGN